MASYETAVLSKLLAGIVPVRRAADGSKALRIRCTDDTLTTATVTVEGTQITLTEDATPTVIGVGDAATIGALVSAINAETAWEAVAEDALNTYAVNTNELLAAGAADASGDAGMTVYFDTSAVNRATLKIGNKGLPSEGTTNVERKNRAYLIQTVIGPTAATATFSMYQRTKAGVESTVWSEALESTSDVQSIDHWETNGVDVDLGADMILEVVTETGDATTIIQAATESYKLGPIA
jgi:hypothetical protein